MVQEVIYDLLMQTLRQITTDIITILPKLIVAVVVLTIAILAIKLLNRVFHRILKLADLDKLFQKLVKIKLPFSLNSLIIFLLDIGIIFIALFVITNLFFTSQQMELMTEVLRYGARILSVIAMVIFTFIMFNMLVERMRIETRMRGYVIFILLILITMMLIDLTALSTSTKHALVQGLSIGLGIAVGVFAVWFFFHEYIDKYLNKKATQ